MCPSFCPPAVYILLGAGALMMVVGFFGCFGAVRESQCLLASVGMTFKRQRKLVCMHVTTCRTFPGHFNEHSFKTNRM